MVVVVVGSRPPPVAAWRTSWDGTSHAHSEAAGPSSRPHIVVVVVVHMDGLP